MNVGLRSMMKICWRVTDKVAITVNPLRPIIRIKNNRVEKNKLNQFRRSRKRKS
jgi:hypothetical protein